MATTTDYGSESPLSGILAGWLQAQALKDKRQQDAQDEAQRQQAQANLDRQFSFQQDQADRQRQSDAADLTERQREFDASLKAKTELAAQQAQARSDALLERDYNKGLTQWLAAGGDPARFDHAWQAGHRVRDIMHAYMPGAQPAGAGTPAQASGAPQPISVLPPAGGGGPIAQAARAAIPQQFDMTFSGQGPFAALDAMRAAGGLPNERNTLIGVPGATGPQQQAQGPAVGAPGAPAGQQPMGQPMGQPAGQPVGQQPVGAAGGDYQPPPLVAAKIGLANAQAANQGAQAGLAQARTHLTYSKDETENVLRPLMAGKIKSAIDYQAWQEQHQQKVAAETQRHNMAMERMRTAYNNAVIAIRQKGANAKALTDPSVVSQVRVLASMKAQAARDVISLSRSIEGLTKERDGITAMMGAPRPVIPAEAAKWDSVMQYGPARLRDIDNELGVQVPLRNSSLGDLNTVRNLLSLRAQVLTQAGKPAGPAPQSGAGAQPMPVGMPGGPQIRPGAPKGVSKPAQGGRRHLTYDAATGAIR